LTPRENFSVGYEEGARIAEFRTTVQKERGKDPILLQKRKGLPWTRFCQGELFKAYGRGGTLYLGERKIADLREKSVKLTVKGEGKGR